MLHQSDYIDGGVPVVNPINLVEGEIVADTTKTVSEETAHRLENYRLKIGDILVGRRGDIGRYAIAREEHRGWLCGTGCFFIRPGRQTNPDFMGRLIGSPQYRQILLERTTGATMPNLSNSTLSNLEIPLPPLEEQQRIVGVLDEAIEGLSRARALAEANLQDARELFDAAVSQCFVRVGEQANSTRSLGSIATFRNGLNYTRSSNGKSVKIVGVGDFKDHFLVPVDTLSEITMDGDLDDQDILRPGDLLAVRSNGNRELIGRTMLVPETPEVISFSGFTIRIRLDNRELLPEYLCEFMRTKAARRVMIDGGGGSNISNLNQKLLSGLRIAFPDGKQQQAVLEELDRVRTQAGQLVAVYQTKLQSLDALRQALLQKAFAGELT